MRSVRWWSVFICAGFFGASARGGDAPRVGQVSRDIGVRFTLKTSNLTTHIVDADVDDSRDSSSISCRPEGCASPASRRASDPRRIAEPRRNLTGEPYFTEGCRGVVFLSKDEVEWRHLDWESPYVDAARRRAAGG